MKLLLVDDDIDVIDGILEAIDFGSIGYTNIYTAIDSEGALNILKRYDIDVMITDIELPGKTGLEILEWVRDNNLPVVTLFCTSYAYFNYAKKAIELHCFDYFLKPIEYDELKNRLIEAREEAISKFSAKKSDETKMLEKAAKNNFWYNVLSNGKIDEETSAYFSYNGKTKFTVVITGFITDSTEQSLWKFYAHKNITDELLNDSLNFTLETEYSISDNVLCYILRTNGCSNEEIEAVFTKQLNISAETLELHTSIYYSPECKLEEVVDSYTEALSIFTTDVLTEDKVVNINSVKLSSPEYINIDSDHYLKYFISGSFDKAYEELMEIVDSYAKENNLNSEFLHYLRIDVSKIIYLYLDEIGVDTRILFADENFEKLRKISLHSLTNFKTYIKYLLDLTEASSSYTHEENELINQVKEYIEMNIGSELSRLEIAKSVYLNPDYLARIFKSETGKTLGAYILDERMKTAEIKLLETNEPINSIALEVGYDNFSYFSQLFKKKTGLTPNEYRKANKR